MAGQAPIITYLSPEAVQSFLDYMDELRSGNVDAAKEEAARLSPYFNALSAQLGLDAKAVQDQSADLAELAEENNLSELFNTVAERTNNTILSELVLGPQALLNRKDTMQKNKQFGASSIYDGHSFTLGFMQVFNRDKTSSVSVPMLTFENLIMINLNKYELEPMLRALQVVATAGNHDMLHHYTNVVLNSAIARPIEDKSLPVPPLSARDWFDKNFSNHKKDSDANSYESWLMLNHSRIRNLMEAGPEGEVLKKNCDVFFDELAQLGQEIAAKSSVEQAHDAVDYFGTILLYTMMRYMPMDHPLIEHAIDRLQQADPASAVLEEKKQDIITEAHGGKPYMAEVLANYKAAGIDLLPDNSSYADLKRLQVIEITPWIAHLLGPAQPGTLLAAMQERVGQVNIDMIKDTALGFWFNMKDGVHFIDLPDNKTVEMHFKNGVLHRENGPAFIKRAADGSCENEYYRDGIKIEQPATQPSSKPAATTAMAFRH